MKHSTKQMLFLTVFCFIILIFIMPNYLGFMPDILVLSSPFAVFVAYLELEKRLPFSYWISFQVIATSLLLFFTLFI